MAADKRSGAKHKTLFGDDEGYPGGAVFAGAAPQIETMTRGVPTDSGLSSQWHLTGTWGLHANLVWPDYTGAGMLLADLDDGFQYTHPDLAPNYNTSLDRDFVTNDFDAAPGSSEDNHGTAVMGVMIADDNGSGVVGVAFDATGVGIRMGFGPTDGLDEVLNGFSYARSVDVDVMNNSWGYNYPYDDSFADPAFSQIAAVIKSMADTGRDGLGSNIVFAAGNSRGYGDNVNHHSFQNSPYTIAVAAIDSTGHVAPSAAPALRCSCRRAEST
jgi:subtilisin family serine protease